MCRSICFFLVISLSIVTVCYADELLVVNGSAETLSRVNLETGVVDNNVLTLGLWPNDVTVVRDSAYILNSGPSTIYVYDLISNQLVDVIDLGDGRNPWKIVPLRTDTLLVSNWLTYSITEVVINGDVVGEYELPGENPQGIAVRGDTSFITSVSFIWQDTSYESGSIIAWDNRGDSALLPIQVGENPSDLTFAPNGKLYVVCTGEYNGSGSVYVVDPDQLQVADSLLIGGDPTDIVILPNGTGFLAAGEGWFPPGSNGHVLTFDANSNSVLHGHENPLLTDGGVMSLTAASDSTVFSMNFADDTVTELDSAGNILRTFVVGDGAQVAAVWLSGPPCDFARGDANASGGVDIDDAVFLITYIFGAGDIPVCDGVSGDVDCSSTVDIDDVVYLITYIFGAGPEPCSY